MSKSESSNEQPPYDLNSLESLGCHMMFGEVNTDTAFSACDFIVKSNLMRRTNDPITIIVNTVGGDCTEGFAIIDLIETSRIPVSTVGIGSIASMGVLLIAGGTRGLRTMTKNTEVMAHQFSAYFSGKQHELIATQAAYTMLEQRFLRHFLRHSSMTEKKIRDVLFAPSDRYLSPTECKKYGLIDRVVDFFDQPAEAPVKRVRADRVASAPAKPRVAAKRR
jgi:ATP-dependent Clp protease, protease subunit